VKCWDWPPSAFEHHSSSDHFAALAAEKVCVLDKVEALFIHVLIWAVLGTMDARLLTTFLFHLVFASLQSFFASMSTAGMFKITEPRALQSLKASRLRFESKQPRGCHTNNEQDITWTYHGHVTRRAACCRKSLLKPPIALSVMGSFTRMTQRLVPL